MGRAPLPQTRVISRPVVVASPRFPGTRPGHPPVRFGLLSAPISAPDDSAGAIRPIPGSIRGGASEGDAPPVAFPKQNRQKNSEKFRRPFLMFPIVENGPAGK